MITILRYISLSSVPLDIYSTGGLQTSYNNRQIIDLISSFTYEEANRNFSISTSLSSYTEVHSSSDNIFRHQNRGRLYH